MSIVYFASESKDDCFVLTKNGEVEKHLVNPAWDSLISVAQNITKNTFGIDRSWPLFYKQVGVLDKKNNSSSLVLHLVYSVYFPERIPFKSDIFEWADLRHINSLSELDQDIIRFCIARRY